MNEGMDQTIHVVSVRDLHDKPLRIRYWLDRGHELILTYRGKVRAFIRPYDAERDEPYNGPRIKDIGGRPEHFEEGKRVFMTLEDIRTNMDVFIFGLEDGYEFIVGHYFKKLGVATRDIPADAVERIVLGEKSVARDQKEND